jgi:serine/threonine-protein kinase
MEYLFGVTLGKEIKTHGALTSRRTLHLSIQICHALDAAHSKGIVHRDLKPENIFIVNPVTQALDDDTAGRHQDVIKLLDFGIAKITWDDQGRRLTKVGSVFGTPQYMSPEQAAGKDTDHRGDVYSLGCIIYEMLTGEVPFLADTFMGTLTKQMFENPVPPRQLRPDLRIPEPVEQVILGAMSKEPEQRHQTMKELANALEACFRHDTGPVQLATEPAATPQVVLLQSSASLEELTAEDRETVHLLERSAEEKPLDDDDDDDEADHQLPVQPAPLGARLVAIVAGVGLFAGLTGGGIYLVLRSDSNPPATPDAAAAVAPSPDARRPDTRAVIAAGQLDLGRTVRLTLRSIPKGASIYLGGQLVGKTPKIVTVPEGQEQRYVFVLRGYHQEKLVADAVSDREHMVPLKKLGQSGVVTTVYGSTKDLRNPFRKKGLSKKRGTKKKQPRAVE